MRSSCVRLAKQNGSAHCLFPLSRQDFHWAAGAVELISAGLETRVAFVDPIIEREPAPECFHHRLPAFAELRPGDRVLDPISGAHPPVFPGGQRPVRLTSLGRTSRRV